METEGIPKGTLIDGRYNIREHLGQGGMGAVYRAEDTKLGQIVALKMLLHTGGSERSKDDRRRRFMREIHAINEVQHRNVVHIQEFGFYKDTPYMVMEFLQGKDLNKILRTGPELLAIDHAVDLMLPVCAAVQSCHDSGVIHRDLKPGNIMVIETDYGAGWDIKVVDFSISKVATDLTQDGQILGTPNFLSPEQVSGKVLPASDQYAIGLLLYVCLTKKHPYAAFEGLPLIRAIEKGGFKGPREFRPDIPEELEQIILTAMHLDPAKRYADVHELGQKLWPFGSTLGQGVWKKYYFQTPAAGRARSDAKRSTTGIPLVLQMADGKVPMTPATVLAHYQSTTAVKGSSKTSDDAGRGGPAEIGMAASPSEAVNTIDDHDARPFAPSGASAPSGLQWQKSSAEASSSEVGKPRSRQGAVGKAAIAVGLVLGIVAAVAATRAARNPPAPPPASVVAPTPPTFAGQPKESPSERPSSPVPPLPAAAAMAPKQADTTPVRAAVEQADHKRKSKRADHDLGRGKPKAGDWQTDADGNPIPPM